MFPSVSQNTPYQRLKSGSSDWCTNRDSRAPINSRRHSNAHKQPAFQNIGAYKSTPGGSLLCMRSVDAKNRAFCDVTLKTTPRGSAGCFLYFLRHNSLFSRRDYSSSPIISRLGHHNKSLSILAENQKARRDVRPRRAAPHRSTKVSYGLWVKAHEVGDHVCDLLR